MMYLVMASLVWAVSFGLIKHHLAGLDSNFVALARLALSGLLFLPFLRPRGGDRGLAGRLLLVGAVQYGLMYLLYLFSFRYLAAYQVAMFTILTPLYVTLIHDVEVRRFHPRHLLAAGIAVAGAAVIVSQVGDGHGVALGFLAVQGSNLCFAFGQVEYRRLKRRFPRMDDTRLFGLMYLGATLVALVPAAVTTPWTELSLTRNQIVALLYLGFVPSGLCFFLWNLGATRARVGTLAVMNNAKIPLAVVASLLLFRERADLARLLAGSAIIAVALFLAGRPPVPDSLAKAGSPDA